MSISPTFSVSYLPHEDSYGEPIETEDGSYSFKTMSWLEVEIALLGSRQEANPAQVALLDIYDVRKGMQITDQGQLLVAKVVLIYEKALKAQAFIGTKNEPYQRACSREISLIKEHFKLGVSPALSPVSRALSPSSLTQTLRQRRHSNADL